VCAARRKRERAPRGDAEEAPVRIKDFEQRMEVGLIGAASVEEHEEPFGLRCRRPDSMRKLIR
jgi:hypothetical protein